MSIDQFVAKAKEKGIDGIKAEFDALKREFTDLYSKYNSQMGSNGLYKCLQEGFSLFYFQINQGLTALEGIIQDKERRPFPNWNLSKRYLGNVLCGIEEKATVPQKEPINVLRQQINKIYELCGQYLPGFAPTPTQKTLP